MGGMAILVMANGKFAETNKGALQRAARDKGDVIAFTQRPHFEDVLLNHNPVGKLFESHEQAIAYLASQLRLQGVKPKRKTLATRSNPARQTIITKGNRAVVINEQDGRFWANVYVNARNGIKDADITAIRWAGNSMASAKSWAEKQLGATAKANPAQKKSDGVTTVEITPAVFKEHIKPRVRQEFKTFAAYKKSRPHDKAQLLPNGKLWRVVTSLRAGEIEFDNGQGRRIGKVKPNGKAFYWEFRDPAGNLIFNSQRNNPNEGGLFTTREGAIRSMKNTADTFGG